LGSLLIYFFSFNSENNTDLKIDNSILKSSAVKNPETAKPATNLSANKIIIALITKINKPKVTIVAGNVKKINKGLTTIFNKAITTATIIAEKYPDTVTPGKTVAKTNTAKAVNRIFKNVFIFINFNLKSPFCILKTTIRLGKHFLYSVCHKAKSVPE
jgi:hypothetical protein